MYCVRLQRGSEVSKINIVAKYPVDPLVVIALLVWFLVAVVIFCALLIGLSISLQSEDSFTNVVGFIVWPYSALVMSVPAAALLAKHIIGLLGFRDDIKEIPQQLEDALGKAERLKLSIEQISAQATNNISEAIGGLESKIGILEERLGRIREIGAKMGEEPTELPPREKLDAHLAEASNRFYEVLERWNNDGRRRNNILVVTRGGGNRPELVDRLEEAGVFDKNEQQNSAIAEYIREVFRAEMGARRGGVQIDRIQKLDEIRLRLNA